MTAIIDKESRTNDISQENLLRKRALVVEDDETMSALIREIVGTSKTEVINPDAIIETGRPLVLKEKFDVVLVCVRSSWTRGIVIVRMIRKLNLNRMTPIIMISDDQRLSMLPQAFDAGVSLLVYKPIGKIRLMKLIGAAQGLIEHEQRRFRRVLIQAEVRIKSEKAELAGETIDVSLNGTLVRASHTLPLGTRVEVALYIPPETLPIVGGGSVVRIVNDTQMGLVLDRFSGPEMARLQECLLPQIAG